MRAHAKPTFAYQLKLEKEIKHIEAHRKLPDRSIPAKTKKNLIVATWNLTNFGLQQRQDDHLRLMAEIMKPFDLVAVQEVADDLTDSEALAAHLGAAWDYYYTDVAGNKERLGFFYNQDRVMPTGLAAELAMRGYERSKITIDDVESGPFEGFNRNPFMFGFAAGNFEFFLVNVHLYWSNLGMRQLETMALAKWASSRVNKQFPPHNDIILIGDFNMPHIAPGDPIFDQVAQYGLTLPAHTTDVIGTNLAGDKNYDQIAFFPSRTNEDFTNRIGGFDFDNAIFPDLYAKDRKKFFQYVRYYIADHRPMWAEFRR